MSSIAALPSTLDGIKRLAKAIKRERGVTHHEALDLAAQRARYQNYQHAHAQLIQAAQAVIPTYPIYLSAYWAQRGGAGRETMTIRLPKSLSEIIAPHQVSHARNLGRFKMEASDHLERKTDVDSQAQAHKELFAAARTLEFMAVTGLVPATNQKQYALMRAARKVPGNDHPSEWIHAESGAWVYMDEPYRKPGLERREDWVSANGMAMVQPSWEGIYSPGMSLPFLFSSDADLIRIIADKVRNLRLGGKDSIWDGESESYFSQFVSPAREASGKQRRARPMPAYRGVERKGALPYGARRGGESSQWRPAARMPLEMHLQLGPIMAALNGGLNGAPHRATGRVRSTLDDWLQMEYPGDEMTSEQFHEAYYGAHREPIEERLRQVKALDSAIQLLRSGYADCAPRNEMIDRLNRVRDQLVR